MGRYILSDLNSAVSSELQLRTITPSKAIASYLKVPHYSLESLTQNIVRRRGIGIASALMSRRLLQNAVREVIETQDVEGTAKAFLSTVKDLLRSGVDLHQLQKNSDLRIRQLSSLAIAYRQQLRQIKRIDAAELYWQGTSKVNRQAAYTFYGYFAPSQDEVIFINAIAGQNSIFVLPINDLYPRNQQLAGWLQERGWEIAIDRAQTNLKSSLRLQQCFKQTSIPSDRARLNIFANLEEEIRGALTQVKVLQSQGVAAQDIVLIAREERLYGEILMDLAWEYNLPVQVCYEIPLEQTRLGAWLKLLLEVVRDNFPFEATAKLLSHPLARQMSLDIWAKARESHPQSLAAWQDLGVDLNLLEFQASHSRSFWVDRLLEILAAWDVLENAKSWAREVVAYYRLQSGLTELRRSGVRQLSKPAFSNEIDEILSLLTVPAQPGRGGIDLHCPTSVLGTSYPYVFVLGCVEGILPRAIADEPILDFHSRKQLARQGFNLPTATDLARQETWEFYCLLNVPRQQIIFSYPELLDRNLAIPSPYLDLLGLTPSPVDNLPVASIERARQIYLRQPEQLKLALPLISKITHALEVETSRESATAPDTYDGIIGIAIEPQQQIFSASQLTQLGQCPFKWFGAKLLQLKKLPEAESELDAAVRGVLYHRCLELAFDEIATASDLAQFNRERLELAFTAAERELKLNELSDWALQRQEHIDLLALNLTTAEFLPADSQVIATETKFEMQWHGLEIRGQVDRIDRTATGLTVIDYKTSSVTPAGVKDDTGKANVDLQLAVYQDAIAVQYPNEAIEAASYYSLSKQKIIGRPKRDPAELAAFAARVKTHLESGSYPVAPDLDRKACRYCDYDLVCRQGDRLARKPT